MILLCNNCDMHFSGRKPIGWHGVVRVRSVKEATTIEVIPFEKWEDHRGINFMEEHDDFDDWWTHEGWCPDCVSEGKCICAECSPVEKTQRDLFSQ